MKTKLLMAIAAASLVALSGCASNPSRQQIGTATGAVVGGVVGSSVGLGTAGTVGGAAAGALIGNELSKNRR
ncbi:glycine zipper 2TM domain-containing protein [Variovorax terrae]|uniref:YgdI/YgdR family lipoprotein n=1 Tax=Variovorax terrae TaxID=2923278 RepID=A0A9X1VT35_9BURK|nr:glycine zipper 2TM domain-containing protein [Variovorax terrae]MCJ0762609.1 YgdI/YgdR family lipoprotein [Variovorax terrae]